MNYKIFQVLSEPNRLDILEVLQTGSKSVNEIVSRLRLNQPQVSKHLRVLADADMVTVKPIAQHRYYIVKSQPFKELEKWLEKYKNL